MELDRSGSESWTQHVLAVWPRTSSLPSLSIDLLREKSRIIVPIHEAWFAHGRGPRAHCGRTGSRPMGAQPFCPLDAMSSFHRGIKLVTTWSVCSNTQILHPQNSSPLGLRVVSKFFLCRLTQPVWVFQKMKQVTLLTPDPYWPRNSVTGAQGWTQGSRH